jgi:hypothetical protein
VAAGRAVAVSERGEGHKAPGDGASALSYRRPYLSDEDLAILSALRKPGESALAALRRILREAAARRPVEQALWAVEARLARLESGGSHRGGIRGGTTAGPQDDADSRAAVMRALRLYTEEDGGG